MIKLPSKLFPGLSLAAAALVCSCGSHSDQPADDNSQETQPVSAPFAKGADVSWVTQIGMPHDQPGACRDLIARMMTADTEGIFYWEPEAPAGYNGGYTLGCFDNSMPTVALSPLTEK